MRKFVIAAIAAFAATSAHATPCDEVKAKIEAKITAKGVKEFSITPVAVADVKPEDKVVGTCEAGAKKLVYKRGKPAS